MKAWSEALSFFHSLSQSKLLSWVGLSAGREDLLKRWLISHQNVFGKHSGESRTTCFRTHASASHFCWELQLIRNSWPNPEQSRSNWHRSVLGSHGVPQTKRSRQRSRPPCATRSESAKKRVWWVVPEEVELHPQRSTSQLMTPILNPWNPGNGCQPDFVIPAYTGHIIRMCKSLLRSLKISVYVSHCNVAIVEQSGIVSSLHVFVRPLSTRGPAMFLRRPGQQCSQATHQASASWHYCKDSVRSSPSNQSMQTHGASKWLWFVVILKSVKYRFAKKNRQLPSITLSNWSAIVVTPQLV